MTEADAHAALHGALPAGSKISLSRSLWSWSTAGDSPPLQATSGEWHLTVMIKEQVVDRVEVTTGQDLARVVQEMLSLIADSKPPKLSAPSQTPFEDRREVI